ncbi:DUF1775 domain-containing protein [Kitasatospora sp. NPDC048540]|uniref:DUF1775 domain-containing protein n=1 Tax=Kitasatospora sp. NPDC048540 TaxID=3155634 RepID=UPI00340C0BAA
MNRSRLLARAALPTAVLLGSLALAGPASAHVEVESPTPQALAVGAVVAFSAEGESTSAGIKEVRVVLPSGLMPGDVSLADGPSGWTLSPTEDGYTVAGPALAPGADAEYKIKVRQLPDAPELAFKSLVTYTDGQVDRWIELPQGGAQPAHPAPVLKLTAAAPGAVAQPGAPAPGPSTPAATPAATTPSPAGAGATASGPAPAPVQASPTAEAQSGKQGSAGVTTLVIGVVAVVLVAAAGWYVRRRGAARG